MKWNFVWQDVINAYMRVVDGTFDEDHIACKTCFRKVISSSTELLEAKALDALHKK